MEGPCIPQHPKVGALLAEAVVFAHHTKEGNLDGQNAAVTRIIEELKGTDGMQAVFLGATDHAMVQSTNREHAQPWLDLSQKLGSNSEPLRVQH